MKCIYQFLLIKANFIDPSFFSIREKLNIQCNITNNEKQTFISLYVQVKYD